MDIRQIVHESFEKSETLLDESSLSRLNQAMKEHTCGAITAYRSCKEEGEDGTCLIPYTKKENQARNKSLVAKLKDLGYGVTAVKGSYIENYGDEVEEEVSEHSFFVTNIKTKGDDGGQLKKDLQHLGEEFDQDSVLIIPFEKEAYLLGTNDADFPGKGKTMKVGNFKGGKEAEFMSRVNNRSFVFETFSIPKERAGKHAVHIAAKKHWTEFLD